MVPAVYDVQDLSDEPILVLDMQGSIQQLNRAARRHFENLKVGDQFSSLLKDPASLWPVLTHFSRCGEPAFASLELARADVNRQRITGMRISGQEPATIAIRFDRSSAKEFSILSQQVAALNGEIHEHRRARLRLEASLSANLILYRELQHRVKNHLQMVMGMLAMTKRKASTPAERGLITEIAERLSAIAEVQRLMYDYQSTSGVPADKLINGVANGFKRIAGDAAQVIVESTNADFSNEVATAVALILNELFSNAAKYGGADGECNLKVSCQYQQGVFDITVRDHGCGYPESIQEGGTGLTLIRGLCRQIGATLALYSDQGAWCVIRFSDNRPDAEAIY